MAFNKKAGDLEWSTLVDERPVFWTLDPDDGSIFHDGIVQIYAPLNCLVP